MLLALVALLVAAMVTARVFEAGIAREEAAVRATPPATRRRPCPAILEAFLLQAGPSPQEGLRTFRVEQRGEMRMTPASAWMPFRATQVYAVATPSFVWSARFAKFKVVDSLVDGTGRLEARLFGVLPVAKASGAAATRAQLLRYLAETPWVPQAIAFNPAIDWTPQRDHEVQGRIVAGDVDATLSFHFDGNGDIVRVEGLRPRTEGPGQVETPWVGFYSEYRELNGVRVPTHGEAQWILDSGPFTYWRGSITRIEFE